MRLLHQFEIVVYDIVASVSNCLWECYTSKQLFTRMLHQFTIVYENVTLV
jgi:hypothetical protein